LHEPNHSRSDVSRHSAARRKLALALPDEAATIAFAARLAPALQPGLVIYLRGDLGAGKTTLVRALLHKLGYTGRVKSPTYTLVERYEAAGLHCLVEWPEQAAGLLPPADVSITLEILQDGRELALHAYTEAGQKCLNAL
jgi:tRNA threonylcarbamoyladenosine biosynthesis protein TsaE